VTPIDRIIHVDPAMSDAEVSAKIWDDLKENVLPGVLTWLRDECGLTVAEIYDRKGQIARIMQQAHRVEFVQVMKDLGRELKGADAVN
jgi:hypothetical protein